MRVGAPADPNYSLDASGVRLFGRNGLVTSSLIYDRDGYVTCKSTDGVTTTCASDAFGNRAPRVIVSHACTSNISQVLDYFPYGALRVNTGSDVSQRKYIGQFTDPTGIDYLNARYFLANQGQFISRRFKSEVQQCSMDGMAE
jgi:hypothetical protein